MRFHAGEAWGEGPLVTGRPLPEVCILFAGIVLCSALAVPAYGAEAAGAPGDPFEVEEAEPEVRRLIERGRSLLDAGQFKDAYVALREAFIANPANTGISFYMGQAAFGAGLYEDAVTAYERILQMRPGLHRVRLELARAYYKLGAMEQARAAFEEVLAADPPEEVRNNVERFLAAIDEAIEERDRRSFFTGRFTAAVSHDSNPRVAPDSQLIDVVQGGQLDRLRLDAATFADEDHYASFSAYLKHTYLFPSRAWQWRTAFSWFGTSYDEQSEQNIQYASVKTGPARRWGRFDVELLATLGQVKLDGENYRKMHGVEINATANINRNVMLGATVQRRIKKAYYDRDEDGVNYFAALRPIVVWGPDGENRLYSELSVEREFTGEGSHTRNGRTHPNYGEMDQFTRGEASIRYVRKLPWHELSPYLGYSYARTVYDARNPGIGAVPGFPAVRRDNVNTFTIGITKALPWKMSVDLMHVRTYANSTVDLYEYDRHQTRLSIAKDF